LQAAFLIYGMNHIQISIEAKEEQQEILISELAEFDAIGFEQTTSHLLSYFEEENFRSYEITKLLKDYIFHFTTLPKQNWNAVWESNFEPVVVDDFCAIRAEFHKPIQNVQHEIIITPKMSFGTGHHATTYMMIQQMRNINFIDKKVFDFGTGTGILAILATKLGAASITAIDNDEWSIKNAEENFRSYEITKLLKDYVFHFTTLPKQNWNAVWESNFEPVVVDDFCAIRAEFHKPIQNVQHEIIITPKMSFGTGHHATTYMMIQQMRNISFIDKKVFDFGTGTGILAILATKLGAASVTAIDNDEWSIKNAEENFEKNNVHSICLYQSSTVSEKNFDIILANINRSVLEQYSSTLVNLLSSQGVLLVSGLLKEDEPFIVELFDELTLYNSQQNQNWISLLFTTK